jgi:hypothetical protein
MQPIIHIGYSKTATTWFQKQFYPNIKNAFYPSRKTPTSAATPLKSKFLSFEHIGPGWCGFVHFTLPSGRDFNSTPARFFALS